jgi:hypothetical protein
MTKLILKSTTFSHDHEKQSWIERFKNLYENNKQHAKCWFWDNFNWSNQSLWIGKINRLNHLPTDDDRVFNFLKKLITDLNNYTTIKSQIYVKFYFSRNVTTKDPEINYLLICNNPHLPPEFEETLVNVVFEKYQLTQSIVDKDPHFKDLINHYINWSNFYTYYDLMRELHF